MLFIHSIYTGYFNLKSYLVNLFENIYDKFKNSWFLSYVLSRFFCWPYQFMISFFFSKNEQKSFIQHIFEKDKRIVKMFEKVSCNSSFLIYL
jgi:hypothetical protein